MSTPPPTKRARTRSPRHGDLSASIPGLLPAPFFSTPRTALDTLPPPKTLAPTNPRKRAASGSPKLDVRPPSTTPVVESSRTGSLPISALLTDDVDVGAKKKSSQPGRTNTPWTAVEEQRLSQLRSDKSTTWKEIAKSFPNRTEGSVKKHYYKDMHHAEFSDEEAQELLAAIREFELNKWRIIGEKLGKPPKACEAYAREHFSNLK